MRTATIEISDEEHTRIESGGHARYNIVERAGCFPYPILIIRDIESDKHYKVTYQRVSAHESGWCLDEVQQATCWVEV